MEVINLEIKNLDDKGDVYHLTESFCKDLENFSLLDLSIRNIFTEIANAFLYKFGYNKQRTSVIMEYIDKLETNYNNLIGVIDKNGEPIDDYEEKVCIIPLTNNGHMYFYDSVKRNQIVYNPSKIGECILINGINIKLDIFNCNKYIKLYYLKTTPDIEHKYKSYDNIEKKIIISMVKPERFIEIKKGLETTNGTFIIDTDNYINLEIDTEESIYRKEIENKKKLIIPLIIKKEEEESDLKFFLEDNDDVSLISESNCPLNRGSKILDLYDMSKIEKSYYKLDFENVEVMKEYQTMCRNIIKNVNIIKEEQLLQEKQNHVFINKIDLSNEEKFIMYISEKILYEEMNIIYNLTEHDVAIDINHPCEFDIPDLIYSFILTFDTLDNDEILIMNRKMNINKSDKEDSDIDILLNHIYIYNPESMSIVGIKTNMELENKINIKNFIRINIYKHIGLNYYTKCSSLMSQKMKYKNYDNNIVDKFVDKLEINYTKQNDMKIISTLDNNYLQKKHILPIYKNYLCESRSLIFCYDNNDMIFIDEIKGDIVYNVYNLQINKKVLDEFKNISSSYDNITVINNLNVLFIPVLNIFKNVVINAIEKIYGKDIYLLNVKRCFITGNKEKDNNFNSIYSDLYENIKRNMVIYVSINIEINSDNFGRMIMYTNYINYSNKNYNNKNTLEFIIDAVDRDS